MTTRTQTLAATRIIVTDGATGDEEWRGTWGELLAANELDAETVAEAEAELMRLGETVIGTERISLATLGAGW